jgi:3-hydroxyacyl-CoA dehydrogenase
MDVTTIAVIGAGVVGREIACASALGGYNTILEDVSDSLLSSAMASIRGSLDEEVKQGKLAAATREAALARLSTSNVVDEAIRDAELIIEAVPEELEMKLELFTIFDRFAKPNAIFASHSSSLSISDYTDIVIARDRCIGMRFFNTVIKMQAVEFVRTAHTSEETVAVCCEVAKRIGWEEVIVREAPAS